MLTGILVLLQKESLEIPFLFAISFPKSTINSDLALHKK